MEKKICNFCGYPTDKYVDGLGACICHNCIETTAEIKEELTLVKDIKNNSMNILKPHEIKSKLDEYVVGQEDAKKKIAVEIYNHYKRINTKSSFKIELPKNNILLLGPTGSGKTYLLKKLSEILDVPIAFGDANELTASGYVGKDVDNLLRTLIEKANGDVSKAEKGIIYIDEIDKITENKNEKDVGTTSVQQALLTMMEGCEYFFEKKNAYDNAPRSINTKNILFICGGAFVGLENIIKARLSKGATIGFGSEPIAVKTPEDLLHKVDPEDLFKFGFIKEFIGRVPTIAVLDKLSENDLKNILVKPKNSIVKQYQALFKMDNVKLKFSDEALNYIAKKAMDKGTGARGLKNIISDVMTDVIFTLPQQDVKEFEVTKELFEKEEV